jgi:hypothetical protein
LNDRAPDSQVMAAHVLYSLHARSQAMNPLIALHAANTHTWLPCSLTPPPAPQDIFPNWPSMLRSLDNGAAGLAQWAGPGGWNDPDMLEVRLGDWGGGGRDIG